MKRLVILFLALYCFINLAYSQRRNAQGLKMVKEVCEFNVVNNDTSYTRYIYSYDDQDKMKSMEVWINTYDYINGKGWGEEYLKMITSYSIENGKLERYSAEYPWQKCEFFLDENGNLIRWLLYANDVPKSDCTLYDTSYIYEYNERRGEWEIKQETYKEAWRSKGTDEFVYSDPKYDLVTNYKIINGILQRDHYVSTRIVSSGIKNDINVPIEIPCGGTTDWVLVKHLECYKYRPEYFPQETRRTMPISYEVDDKGNLTKVSWNKGHRGILIKYVE